MKNKTLLCLSTALVLSATSYAQVAGKATVGVAEISAVVNGWSAKKAILGKTVYNDQRQKVGMVNDIIITPENAISFAIVGVGGFVGVGTHDVAVPIQQFRSNGDGFVLPGATKEALKALPAFEYAKTK